MENANLDSVWSHPPEDLQLKPHNVDIWRVQIDIPDHSRKPLAATLSAEEKERAARFHFAVHRDRFIAAHGCLRDILRRYLHCEPDRIDFSIGKYGKPALDSDQGLEFNLSHSGDYALIAIAHGRRVGIDVEQIRDRISPQAIAGRFFSQAEVSELLSLPLEQQEVAFFTGWARKEAYIKAHGMGLALPLESFDVSLSPQRPAVLRATRPDSKEASRWTLRHLDVDPGYQAAVVVENKILSSENPDLVFRMWDWNF